MANGSCLSEEYTTMIESIHVHLSEAHRLYNSLPQCITRSSNELFSRKEPLGLILAKGVAAMEEFKKDYGIE